MNIREKNRYLRGLIQELCGMEEIAGLLKRI